MMGMMEGMDEDDLEAMQEMMGGGMPGMGPMGMFADDDDEEEDDDDEDMSPADM